MDFRKLLLFVTILVVGMISVVYAADIPIFNFIAGQSSTNDGSYSGVHKSETLGTVGNPGMVFFNKDNDNISVGDFFRGYYYDSMYGIFQVDSNSTPNIRLTVSGNTTSVCGGGYNGYYLEGQSYNPEFGFMSFNNRGDGKSPYICFPTGAVSGNNAYLGGYAYSPYIGYQNFDGFTFDATVDICDPAVDPDCTLDDGAEGRYIYVQGIATSQKAYEGLTGQFQGDIRIVGNIEKSSTKRDINKRIYSLIKNIPSPASITNISDFNGIDWSSVGNNSNRLLNSTVLYIKNPSTIVSLNAVNTIQGKKTIIVENGSVSIDANLLNASSEDILGIIVLKGDTSESGNIYVAPQVTDIHAVMYAEKSILSTGADYSQSSVDFLLKDQLYILGSVMSENTIGGSVNASSLECPFYVSDSDCDTVYKAQKYDLNFLRRYKLSPEYDTDGNLTGNMIPTNGGIPANGDGVTDYSLYPLIIKYNPRLQTTPPPLF